jgi:hypothetical protein
LIFGVKPILHVGLLDEVMDGSCLREESRITRLEVFRFPEGGQLWPYFVPDKIANHGSQGAHTPYHLVQQIPWIIALLAYNELKE